MLKNNNSEKFIFNFTQKNNIIPTWLNRTDIMKLIHITNILELNSVLKDLSLEKFNYNEYFYFTKNELKLIKNYQY